MSSLTISLLGNPKVEIDGAPIEVDTRKAIALLAYLSVTGASHSRDHLTALLWPEFDSPRGRAALRRTLSSLKKAVGDWVLVEGDSIDLDRGEGYSSDFADFLALAGAPESHDHAGDLFCADCREPLSRAVALYRGDFLEGFSLRDSVEFDDWQLFEGEILRRQFGTALGNLVRIDLQQGDFDQALASAHRWLSLDPLNEDAHRQIMLAFARSGQRAAALRQYEECLQLLDRELGVPPLEETTRLYDMIREDRLPPVELAPPTEAAPLPRPGPVEGGRAALNYPLVGRRSAWEALLGAYRSISADGCFVLIHGEAGIGKTRLAVDFLRHAESRSGRGIAMRSYEGEASLAYAPILEGLRSALALPEAAAAVSELPPAVMSEAARLLPELRDLHAGLPPTPSQDDPGAQSRFLESLCQLLDASVRGPQPGVVFLDDLHWADGATLDFITYLAHRLRGRPLLLLAAVRSEALAGDPRLNHLAVAAQGAGLNSYIHLERLKVEDLHDLLASASLSEFGRRFEDRLFRATEGLPFFIVEYLSIVDKVGHERPLADWPVPGGVRDLLHSRLDAVSGMPLQLLATAAVIGRSFEFETLRAASGRSEEEAVSGLEILMDMSLIVEIRPEEASAGQAEDRLIQYDFSHEQLRSLVYGETNLARRRLLHRRVGEALQARSRRLRQEGAFSGLIAQHLQLGGREEEASGYFFQAGEYARAVFANEDAIQQFRLALAAGYADAASLHEAIGDLETLNGQYRAALRSYESAAAASGAENFATLESKIGGVYHRLGEWGLAESHFKASLKALESGGLPVERARVLADLSLNAYRQGDGGEAFRLVEEARQLAAGSGDPRALAQAYNILGILARAGGDLEEAHDYLEKSLRESEEMDDLSAQIAALNNLALVRADRGDLDGAREHLLAAHRLCMKLGDRHREAALYNNLADLSQRADRPEEAMDYLKKAVSLFADVGLEAGELQPEIWKLVEW